MGSEQRGHLERGLEVPQRVGVDHQRYAVSQGRGERVGRLGVAAGADDPGLHPPLADDDLGVRGPDRVGCPTGVPHHAGQPARRAGRRQHAGPRVARRPGADADHAARVLLRVGPGRGSNAATSSDWSAVTAASGRSSPRSTSWTTPHAAGRRLDEVADLVGAERDRQVGGHVVAVEPAGVDVDAARDVDRDHRHAGQRPHGVERGLPQPGPAADADDAVHDDVGRSWFGQLDDPTPGRSQGGQPGLVHAVGHQHGLHARPAARQHRTGVQRVAAVVARADQQQHPPPVGAAEQVDHRGRQPGRGPLHQRTRRAARAISAASAARTCSTVCADLMTPAPPRPRRCRRRGRARGGRGRRRARPPGRRRCRADVNSGRPDDSETTSASCQARLPGAPSALASASFAAKRAASEAGGRVASAGVNSRSTSPGVRRSDVLEARDVDHVDADADDRHGARPTRP